MTNDTVISRLSHRLFGSPLLRNSIRGEVVEEIVAMALQSDWELCAGDWAAFDLRHAATGLRMQVKQSAARQSWHGDICPPCRPRFSIAEKTGRWEGTSWIAEPGRNADLFVFAWHPVTDATADHREPDQWAFFVVPTLALPRTKSISVAGLTSLADAVTFGALAAEVGRLSGPCLTHSTASPHHMCDIAVKKPDKRASSEC